MPLQRRSARVVTSGERCAAHRSPIAVDGCRRVILSAPHVGRARAGDPIRIKWGNDLATAHPVMVRMKTAVAAIAKETNGAVAIEVFPNNQLGGDTDMMTQMRSGALEGGTLPGVIMSDGLFEEAPRLLAKAVLRTRIEAAVAQGLAERRVIDRVENQPLRLKRGLTRHAPLGSSSTRCR